MKKNTKDNIVSGVSAAMGAAAGFSATVHAATHSGQPEVADEVEVSQDEVEVVDAVEAVEAEALTQPADNKPEVKVTNVSHHIPSVQDSSEDTYNNTANTNGNQTYPETTHDEPEMSHSDPASEIEVLSYQRIIGEDGVQMNVATVNDHNQTITYIDTNLDNVADYKWEDHNDNDEIDAGESQHVASQHIDMEVFQQAAEYDPLFAQNDIPYYDNDANVGTLLG